jgi:hypothetical protein
MRALTQHRVNTLNECIVVEALDERGHEYRISGLKGPLDHHPIPTVDLRFQDGPIKESGANGITTESLLAVLIDRLECFQAGPYACPENKQALRFLENGLEMLHRRTKKRMERGVEGTHTV